MLDCNFYVAVFQFIHGIIKIIKERGFFMSKELVFQSVESLQQVVNVINEAAADSEELIKKSIPANIAIS